MRVIKMYDICVFLNTRVENSGVLAWIGDKGLSPFRYLFNGRTIRIIRGEWGNPDIEVHRVASFHKRGWQNSSRTNEYLTSSFTNLTKTILSIVFLIPGMILGAAFKGLAYLFPDVRSNHKLTKESLTPTTRII